MTDKPEQDLDSERKPDPEVREKLSAADQEAYILYEQPFAGSSEKKAKLVSGQALRNQEVEYL